MSMFQIDSVPSILCMKPLQTRLIFYKKSTKYIQLTPKSHMAFFNFNSFSILSNQLWTLIEGVPARPAEILILFQRPMFERQFSI